MKNSRQVCKLFLLSLLACASGCQWDSVRYDSYVAAFGEGGIEGYDPCEGMEYILVRDMTGDGEKTSKLYRSTCCMNSDPSEPCNVKVSELENNKLCMAFEFNRCPLTASRCMVEVVTIVNDNIIDDNNINDNSIDTKPVEQNYCAEVICSENAVACKIKYKNVDDGKIKTKFTCIDPSRDNRCNAKCPEEHEIIEVQNDEFLSDALDRHYGANTCKTNERCNSVKGNSTEDQDITQYECGCKEGTILCGDACVDPYSETNCGADCTDGVGYAGESCEQGLHCVNTQTSENPKYECKCAQQYIILNEGMNEQTPETKNTYSQYILDPNAAFCKINGTQICINAQTSTTHCGAKDMCTDENAGEQCAEHFKCIDGKCCDTNFESCQLSFTQTGNNNPNDIYTYVCTDGYKMCSHAINDSSKGRQKPTCVPIVNNDNKDKYISTLTTWMSLKFSNDGCRCQDGYANFNGDDLDGCEVGITPKECGIVKSNSDNSNAEGAVNCFEKYHAAYDESTECVPTEQDNTKYQCKYKKCQNGYFMSTDGNCIHYENTCCGINDENQCVNCGNDGLCIPNAKGIYECQQNQCHDDETNCNGVCFKTNELSQRNL